MFLYKIQVVQGKVYKEEWNFVIHLYGCLKRMKGLLRDLSYPMKPILSKVCQQGEQNLEEFHQQP
jgi:hypothetical protein